MLDQDPPGFPGRFIGRTHARTHVILLAQDLDVRINAITGELLRELTIDPSKDYQPTKTHK